MISVWTVPLVACVIIAVSRAYFFKARGMKKLNRLYMAQAAPRFSFI